MEGERNEWREGGSMQGGSSTEGRDMEGVTEGADNGSLAALVSHTAQQSLEW